MPTKDNNNNNNKLNYLAKYYDSNGDEKKKHKKKRKKSKKAVDENNVIKDEVDDDADMIMVQDAFQQQEQDDDEEEEEEGPTVVHLQDKNENQSHLRGVWKDVPTNKAEPVIKASSAAGERNQTQQRRRRRHDSSESSSVGSDRHDNRHPRRLRHDSLSSEEERTHAKRRKRHDSSDEEDAKRHSPDATHRCDSSDQVETAQPDGAVSSAARRRQRHDSFSSQDEDKDRHCRHDSSDESSNLKPPRKHRRRRHDSLSSSDDSRERLSSGHTAGLQTGTRFSKSQAELQAQKRQEAQAMVDKYGHGETVYRDKLSGQKQKANMGDNGNDAAKQRQQEEERLLNVGRVQQQQEEAREREWQEIQQSTFARHANDERLEEMRKNEIRQGDPMAAQAVRKHQEQTQQRGGVPQRPVYKGPPAKPNRFGIRPGFRWDGVDRGNGFEDKLLAKQYNRAHQKEQAYRWSSADM